MAREASGTVVLQAHFEERLTGRGAGNDVARLPHNLDHSRNYGSGTAADQVDRLYSVAAGTTDSVTGVTLDVVGALADILDTGLTVVTAKLRTLIIKNLTADGGGNLLVGGSTNPIGIHAAANDIDVIQPGGVRYYDFGTAGLTCVAATSDEIKIIGSTGTVTYQAIFAGCSV